MKSNTQNGAYRLSASAINTFRPVKNKYTLLTGSGEIIPLIYGRRVVSGHVIAQKIVSGSPAHLYIAVAWCLGEIDQVRRVFLDDAEPVSGVEIRHYKGSRWQQADPWLEAEIASYTDTLVMSFPNRDIGVAHTVFKIPETAYDSIPSFKAIILGQLAWDPRQNVYNEEVLPFVNETAFAFDFDTQVEDFSVYGNDLTLFGSAARADPYLNLPGSSGSYAKIAYHSKFALARMNFTLEIKFDTDTIATGTTRRALIEVTDDSTTKSKSILIYRASGSGDDGNDLVVQLSTDGTTWAIDHTVTSMSASTLYDLKIERVDHLVYIWLNGTLTGEFNIGRLSNIYQNSLDWFIGKYGSETGATEWDGSIRSMRLTVDTFRYGSKHTGINANVPFSDYNEHKQWATGGSTNPAVAWMDLAINDVYGLRSTVDLFNVTRAANWCDEKPYVDGTTKRALSGFIFDSPRPTTDYQDMLAEQANAIWFFQGDTAIIKSDQPYTTGVNASGRELVQGGTDVGLDTAVWTYNDTYWDILTSKSYRTRDLLKPENERPPLPPVGYIYGVGIAANQTITQTITTVAGVVYGVSLDVIDRDSVDWDAPGSTGTLSVKIGATTVIAATSATGALVGTYTGVGGSETLTITAGAGFLNGIDNVSVRPLTWDYTDWISGSLTIRGMSDSDSPTRVSIKWAAFDPFSANWPELTTSAELAGVSTGDVPLRQTVVYMPSVMAEPEAQDRAESRLARTNNRTSVSVVVPDSGIAHQPGDLVRLTSAARGVDLYMKIADITLVQPGRYQINGMKYSADHYPY